MARTTVQISPLEAGIFAPIKNLTFLENDTRVIRAALVSFDEPLQINRANGQFFIRDGDGRERRYAPLGRFHDPALTIRPQPYGSENSKPHSYTLTDEMGEIAQSIVQHSYYFKVPKAVRAALANYYDTTILDEHFEIVNRDEAENGRFYNPHMPFTQQGFEIRLQTDF